MSSCPALCFQRFDQRDANAILDTGNRIEEFELGQQIGFDTLILCQLIKTDNRRIADGIDNGIVDTAAAGFARITRAHGNAPSIAVAAILWRELENS
jgi:hypothetical protein